MALKGLKVIEMAGLAPSPFCARILSDFGASVIRVDRPNNPDLDCLASGKKSILVNMKKPEGLSIIKQLTSKADVFIDPYRPGVLEKNGLGPEELCALNRRLIYARISGFGQSGPLSQAAGHDINYVSLSGVLSMLGRKDGPPTPPINLLADFAGGSLLCALGITMALFERISSGEGQVIDSSMVEGNAYLASWLFASRDLWIWNKKKRGENWLDSGAHFYDTYKTSDNKYISVGAVEPKFYKMFIEGIGLNPDDVYQFDDFEESKILIRDKIKTKTRDEWCKIFEGTDACVTPVLSMDEAAEHPHNKARNSYIYCKDHWEPAPAPILSRTPPSRAHGSNKVIPGTHSKSILNELGYSNEVINKMLVNNVIEEPNLESKL